jgi:hypothetical protein
MHLSAILLALFVSQSIAAALPARESSIETPDFSAAIAALEEASNKTAPKLAYAEASEYGLLEFFLDESLPSAEAATPENPLSKRCVSNQIRCDYTYYRAWVPLCEHLISLMRLKPRMWADDITATCFSAPYLKQSNNRRCISWNKKVRQNTYGKLFPAAVPTLEKCRTGGEMGDVSGEATDVKLVISCVTQCLSNRPGGCG